MAIKDWPGYLITMTESVRHHIADEAHWNDFVVECGGELITPLIARQGVQNADYLFREQRFVIELKELKTEFFDPHIVRIGQAAKELHENPTEEAFLQFERKLFSILEAPLQRILKKANRQIRESKLELAVENYLGLVVCINNGFIGFPPFVVTDMLHRILARERFSSIQGLVYLTNHAVRLAGHEDGAFLWWPYIGGKSRTEVEVFTDWLAEKWADYAAARVGAVRATWDSIPNLRGAKIIGSPTP
jgi:hypothetical protein